jgi:multidrug efflux pump subunit AcrB/outer membrane protein TolC
MNPVRVSLRYPQVTLILTLMLVVVGIHALLTMPRREDPKITIRTGLVSAVYPGATAEQVEKQVTKKIEERLFRFEEVRKAKTYSTSRNDLVIVNVELEDWVKDADKFWAKLRHDMNELKARELPSSVRGPLVNSDFGDTVAVLLAVRGNGYGYRELKDYVGRIEDELRTIRATSKIKRYGEQKEQIFITSTLERIAQYGVNPLNVIQALQQRNVVEYGGRFEAERTVVPMRPSGLFQTEGQIRRVMIGASPSGQPIYIGDLGEVHRRYQDPESLTRFEGQNCLMTSVEMQEGNNIVDFGRAIQEKIEHVRQMLPPDLKLDLIADQPRVVQNRIGSFVREFGIAIGAVILVTMLLLPFRVAAIAALAIPVTVAITFGAMNALGIELHQVSIAALIVVLGMVVDDAIVIADNYVELLDRKVPREEASWRSASEMAVPVLTATLTIIASFLPLLLLSGSVGEFISALPIAVTVALASSFVVAMLLTPTLCRFFIHQGLHDHTAGEEQKPARKKFNVLDCMQATYGKLIHFFMRRKALAVIVGVAAFVGGMLAIRIVPQQFFPSAERDQFVIDVWLPEGTRIETTDAVARRIEGNLKRDAFVKNYATFVGGSAPRFYYNVTPEPPATNFAQLLVNTREVGPTPAFVQTLRGRLAHLAPEARVIVKELQQGSVVQAPVEVRVVGDDLATLKGLGRKVEDILKGSPGAAFVHNDYREDSYQLKVDVDDEVANRLGLTRSMIAMLLAGSFQGAAVSTFWEGDRAVDIVLRLDEDRRQSFDNVRSAYVTSLLTGAHVPLRQVAQLRPEWDSSRIVRRNGVRTLTVRSFFERGTLASQVLKAAQPRIAQLPLPQGYRIDYGGEAESQATTFGEMVNALEVSLVAIYLILLFQFRSMWEPLIVMAAIPLSLLGAAVGLIVTRNTFGFTAFMGVVSLSGIVVRNAIILVDYINERRKAGVELEQAALEAGERRLRPIFLTTMAAAVGVTPMILSGSSLWSPLASTIAVGLLFSMFFTLVVVPVLFVLAARRAARKGMVQAGVALLAVVATIGTAQAAPRKLTLGESVDLALKNNSYLKIAREKVRESGYRAAAAHKDYFPQLSNETNYMRLAEEQRLDIPRGAFGVFNSIGPVPATSLSLLQGANQFFYTTSTLAQPLTQMIKIRQGYGIARLDKQIAETDLRTAENEIAVKVHEAYFGLLITRLEKRAAELEVAANQEKLRDAEKAVSSGNTLEVTALGARASLLAARHAVLTLENQMADLALEFNDLVGLPLDAEVEPAVPEAGAVVPPDHETCLRIALAESTEVRVGEQTVAKARRGVAAARAEYIPEVGAYAQQLYQNGVPFVARNNGVAGLRLTWKVFDFGKRNDVVGERKAQLSQAEENLRRLKNRSTVEVEKSYRKVERSAQMIAVAREALALRREAARLTGDQFKAGVTVLANHRAAEAALAKAEADALAAELGYRLARAELDRTMGRRPR